MRVCDRYCVGVLSLAGLVVSLNGCHSPQSTSPSVSAALERYAHFAAAMAYDSVAALFTDKGELVTAGQPTITGPAAILAHLQSFVGFRVLANDLHADTTRAALDTAYQAGTFRQRVIVPSGDTVVAQGRFTIVWVRDPVSGWRIRRMATGPR